MRTVAVAETELDKAVARIQGSRGYRNLVWAYRCLAVGLVFALLVLVSALVRFLPLTMTLFAVAAVAIVAGVALASAGMIKLWADRVMPRGGTNRHRAMMRELWRDVIKPLQRTGMCSC
jgi:protein-S-isoprenylcysteine O-methyltransferase Ste14